jgi:hypothetical protein
VRGLAPILPPNFIRLGVVDDGSDSSEPKRTVESKLMSLCGSGRIGDAPILAASSVDGRWYTARASRPSRDADGRECMYIHFIGWPSTDDEPQVPVGTERMRAIFASGAEHAAFLVRLRVDGRVDVRRPTGWRSARVVSRDDRGMLLECDHHLTEPSAYYVPTDEYARRLVPAGHAIHLKKL